MLGFRELDRVLRGDAGRDGHEVKPFVLVRVMLFLAAFYGSCMAVYAITSRDEPEFRQMIASALKVPALLVLTLVVTFPSLYVFNTLLGSRLLAHELAKLLTAAMAILIAVLAAFGPIVIFFSVTTTSYPFILVLNVALFGIAGAMGLGYLQKTLGALIEIDNVRRARIPFDDNGDDDDEKPVRKQFVQPSPTRSVFNIWMTVFILVGSQLSWVLRPFIGAPDKPFTWFRTRESSFLEAVWRSLKLTLSGS